MSQDIHRRKGKFAKKGSAPSQPQLPPVSEEGTGFPLPRRGEHASLVLILIFLVVTVLHNSSPNITLADSKWSVYTAMSIIKEGDTDLDEYESILAGADNFAIETVRGHRYSIFPLGTYLLTVPFVFVMDEVLSLQSQDLDSQIRQRLPGHRERFIASVLVGLTALFVYLFLNCLIEQRLALFLTFVFAFCTPAWSTASRSLWQHGPSMLMLAITLYIIQLARRRPVLIQFASIPLAFSYVVRPTNLISVAVLSLLVLLSWRRHIWRYALWSLVVVVPFVAFNVAVYGSLLSPYYLPSRVGASTQFMEAVWGNLISPGRGLLVYSPVLLFSFLGMFLALKRAGSRLIDGSLVAIIFCHLLLISSFDHWWAGHSFGPRYFSDMMPYLIYFLVPVAGALKRLAGAPRTVFVGAFLCLAVLSFSIHLRGAKDWDVYAWNSEPIEVDYYPERLWDWSDTPFLRGILPRRNSIMIWDSSSPAERLRWLTRLGVKTLETVPIHGGKGYYVLDQHGGVHAFGDAVFLGSLPASRIRTVAVDMEVVPHSNGYWILAADGGVFSFGEAQFFGSLPTAGIAPDTPAKTLTSTPSGKGYAVETEGGERTNFGDSAR